MVLPIKHFRARDRRSFGTGGNIKELIDLILKLNYENLHVITYGNTCYLHLIG